MAEIVAAILYNLRNLTRFSGRDSRAQFWPHAIFLFIVQSIINVIITIPLMYSVLTKMMQFVQQQAVRPSSSMRGGPDPRALTQMMQGIFFEFTSVIMITAPLLTGLFTVLVAASVTRRLHDCNKSGYWGLIPLPFFGLGFALMPRLFATWPPTPDFTLFSWLFVINLLQLTALITLIVFLAQRGSAGANRYGPGAPQSSWAALG